MSTIVDRFTRGPLRDSRWLRVFRQQWYLIAASSTLVFAMTVPALWRSATRIGLCADRYYASPCYLWLSPNQLRALEDVGLTAAWHAGLVTARYVVLFAGTLLAAWFVRRASRGWASVAVSWFLVTMFHVAGPAEAAANHTGIVGFAELAVWVAGFVTFVGMLFLLAGDRFLRVFATVFSAWVVVFLVATAVYGEDALWQVGFVAMFIAIGLGVITLGVGFFRSSDPTRRSLLGFTALFVVVFMTSVFFSDVLTGARGLGGGLPELVQRIVAETAIMSLPLLYGMGLVYLIVRRGLWDLDLALNRGVVYGALTTILFTLYFILVAVIQAISSETFGLDDNTLALVVATAVGAAAFVPVRERLQRTVDRLFFRERYDLERTLASFDERIQSRERIEQMADDLVAAAAEAFQPTEAQVWLPTTTEGAR